YVYKRKVLNKYEKKYNTKANISLYQLTVIGLEASTQNILSSLKYKKLNQSLENLKTNINKYYDIACSGNQSIAPTMKRFLIEMELLYTESIKIEYEYYVQKERIKEEQKALREQMKQEAEERKQLEAEKRKIEKEESKYTNEINNINQIISSTSDDTKIAELQKRLQELQNQLNDVQNKKNDIVKLQNGQAGYVYVISNLGSFGNDVFKVGMTRRLEPMDRINELSNASVPFSFDVHSFIFSNNASELEKQLHKELNNYRVNKVNLRKEFFKISIDDLEQLVQRISPTAEFNKTMLAEQYKQGMSIENIPETLSEFTEDDE
ncbi:MAG: GIY-YIG nuclease family protein, partial [Oscillospiraceae bacterium]|nr:GIY-YIG nuclease family protein [Oscillospiraceae bacterium]